MSDHCREQICEAPIGNIWKLLQEELGGIATSRVVLNCLHVILSLAVLGRNLIGAGKELVHIAMNVGKSSEILSRKFWTLKSLKNLVKVRLIESAVLQFGVNVALTESDVHHAVNFVTELGNVIRCKRVDEFLREQCQCAIDKLAIRDPDFI